MRLFRNYNDFSFAGTLCIYNDGTDAIHYRLLATAVDDTGNKLSITDAYFLDETYTVAAGAAESISGRFGILRPISTPYYYYRLYSANPTIRESNQYFPLTQRRYVIYVLWSTSQNMLDIFNGMVSGLSTVAEYIQTAATIGSGTDITVDSGTYDGRNSYPKLRYKISQASSHDGKYRHVYCYKRLDSPPNLRTFKASSIELSWRAAVDGEQLFAASALRMHIMNDKHFDVAEAFNVDTYEVVSTIQDTNLPALPAGTQERVEFLGLIHPENRHQPFSADPKLTATDIVAVDGTSLFKDLPFLDTAALRALPKRSHEYGLSLLRILQLCLGRIPGNYLPLIIEDNYELLTAGTKKSYLDNIYVPFRNFFDGEGEPLSCEEVLSLVFQPFPIQICLSDESWYISNLRWRGQVAQDSVPLTGTRAFLSEDGYTLARAHLPLTTKSLHWGRDGRDEPRIAGGINVLVHGADATLTQLPSYKKIRVRGTLRSKEVIYERDYVHDTYIGQEQYGISAADVPVIEKVNNRRLRVLKQGEVLQFSTPITLGLYASNFKVRIIFTPFIDELDKEAVTRPSTAPYRKWTGAYQHIKVRCQVRTAAGQHLGIEVIKYLNYESKDIGGAQGEAITAELTLFTKQEWNDLLVKLKETNPDLTIDGFYELRCYMMPVRSVQLTSQQVDGAYTQLSASLYPHIVPGLLKKTASRSIFIRDRFNLLPPAGETVKKSVLNEIILEHIIRKWEPDSTAWNEQQTLTFNDIGGNPNETSQYGWRLFFALRYIGLDTDGEVARLEDLAPGENIINLDNLLFSSLDYNDFENYRDDRNNLRTRKIVFFNWLWLTFNDDFIENTGEDIILQYYTEISGVNTPLTPRRSYTWYELDEGILLPQPLRTQLGIGFYRLADRFFRAGTLYVKNKYEGLEATYEPLRIQTYGTVGTDNHGITLNETGMDAPTDPDNSLDILYALLAAQPRNTISVTPPLFSAFFKERFFLSKRYASFGIPTPTNDEANTYGSPSPCLLMTNLYNHERSVNQLLDTTEVDLPLELLRDRYAGAVDGTNFSSSLLTYNYAQYLMDKLFDWTRSPFRVGGIYYVVYVNTHDIKQYKAGLDTAGYPLVLTDSNASAELRYQVAYVKSVTLRVEWYRLEETDDATQFPGTPLTTNAGALQMKLIKTQDIIVHNPPPGQHYTFAINQGNHYENTPSAMQWWRARLVADQMKVGLHIEKVQVAHEDVNIGTAYNEQAGEVSVEGGTPLKQVEFDIHST